MAGPKASVPRLTTDTGRLGQTIPAPPSLPTLHLLLRVWQGLGGESPLLSFLTKSWGFSSVAFDCATSAQVLGVRKHFAPLRMPRPHRDSILVIACVRKSHLEPRALVPAGSAPPKEECSDTTLRGSRVM